MRAVGAHEQRVAMGRGTRDVERGKGSVRARAVFDYDALLERGAKVLRDDAGDRITAAARPERHNHCDRLARISLCARAAREGLQGGSARSYMQESSTR